MTSVDLKRTPRDPVALELVKNAAEALTDEMAITIAHTARSFGVKESLDFATALCDRDGVMVAQGLCIPLLTGAMPSALQAMRRKFAGEEKPGDVYILNDTYSGGTHLPDIFVVKPIFLSGKVGAYACTVAHHVDIGGRVPGGNAYDSTEIYQEGLRIPPARLYEAHEPNNALLEMIALNVRLPEMVLADIDAQLAGCRRGERDFLALAERYGLAELTAHLTELCQYAEELTRQGLKDLPNGNFRFTDFVDDDGISDKPIAIAVELRKRGDELEVDFTGTSLEVRGAINQPLASTRSAVYTTLRCILDPGIPNNAGFFRPIKIIAPYGSFVNPKPPAAVAARGLGSFRVTEALFGALAEMLPDRIFACGVQGDTGVTVAGTRADGSPFILMDFSWGSWGGGPDRDGADANASLPVNMANISIEAIEAELPIRVEQYGFVPDTGGPGRFRGGLALVRDYRLLASSDALVNVRADRRRFAPYGLWGGRPGTVSENWLNSAKGTQLLPTKVLTSLKRGDLLRIQLAGAGGWGSPFDREPMAVEWDVLNGKVTPEHARVEYGVVVVGDPPVIDSAKTASLRSSLRDNYMAPEP